MRAPGAAAFFCTAAAGRVGIAMTGLGLLWLLHARTGSYGTAGLATGAFALAEAVLGPQLARLADRFGQTRVLPFSVAAHGLAIAGVLWSPAPAAIAFACCAGAAVPQLGALSAVRWAHLLRAADLPTAFSLESLANAGAFFLGPVLVTALGAAGCVSVASALAAALIVGGRAALAAQRRTAPPPARPGSLRPRFLRITLLNLAVGLYFGTMGVSVSAFVTENGVPGAATPIVAAGSVAGWFPAGSTDCGGTAPRPASSSSSPRRTSRPPRCCSPWRRRCSGSAPRWSSPRPPSRPRWSC
ncbi:MFS transporter [Amycolatopsis plumensis]|uniref:MFS transporter n=1 Tax=Amycolatopsis plumensis TaxID=236508 RepID=A0ABV5UEN9_9PSEU